MAVWDVAGDSCGVAFSPRLFTAAAGIQRWTDDMIGPQY